MKAILLLIFSATVAFSIEKEFPLKVREGSHIFTDAVRENGNINVGIKAE